MAAENLRFQERRNFKRVPANLALRFCNLDANKWRLARTTDISAKGVSLITREEMLPQTSLDMWLHLPNEGDPLYARGEVVWSEPMAADKYKVGVRVDTGDFVGLSRIISP
jgi:hypothetical protein